MTKPQYKFNVNIYVLWNKCDGKYIIGMHWSLLSHVVITLITPHHTLLCTWREESWQSCAVQWLVLKHTAQQQPPVLSWKNVTGTFFKKYYWIQTRLHSGLMGHVLLLFVSYSRAKKGKLIRAHAVLYLKRWRLFIWQKTPPHTEPEHFKVHHKTFHKPRDTAQQAGLYYD